MAKNILITGATGGIGEATARYLAQKGNHLILTCKTKKEQLTALCDELTKEYNIVCKGFVCDVSNYENVTKLFSEISHLDVLINNAGISHIGLLQDLTFEEWRQIIDTNLSSCFYTSKHAIPLFLQNGKGSIINISSVWGNVGASMEVAYSASKGGMNSFTRALAKELAPSHIRVNAIACGVIETAMNHCFSEEEREALRLEIPADRFGEPIEVAQMIEQLINSPEYLTGQVVTMDGGWY